MSVLCNSFLHGTDVFKRKLTAQHRHATYFSSHARESSFQLTFPMLLGPSLRVGLLAPFQILKNMPKTVERRSTEVGLLLTVSLCLGADLGALDATSRAQEPASTSYANTRTTDSTSTSAAPLTTAPTPSEAPAQSSPPAFLQFPSHAATEREAAQATTAAPANSRATEVRFSHMLWTKR